MNFLMISKDGDGLSMAYKIGKEGNAYRVWIKNPKYDQSGLGIVERVESWRPSISWSDCVVFDMVGFGNLKQLFKERGRPTIGCDPFLDIAELDRGRGIELFHKAGIRTARSFVVESPSQNFESFSNGTVLKPYGNIETSKTYIIN